jgi:hypothetical protein
VLGELYACLLAGVQSADVDLLVCLQPTRLVIDADGILLELCMINGGFLVWMI